jgi:hypothetical protein
MSKRIAVVRPSRWHATSRDRLRALRFTQRLVDAGIAPSTGNVGDSFDNSLAENLWSAPRSNQSTDPQLHSRPERGGVGVVPAYRHPRYVRPEFRSSCAYRPLVRRRRPGQSHARQCLCGSPRSTVEDRCVLRPTHERCRSHKSTEDAGTDCMTWEFLIVDAALLIESRATKPKKQEAVIKNPGDTALPVSRISHVDT